MKRDHSAKVLIRGSIVSLAAVLLIGIINLLMRRTLALHLEPVDYGFIYSIFSLFSILIALFDAGLGQSGVILISRDNAQKNHNPLNPIFSALFTLRLGIAFLLMLMAIFFSKALTTFYFNYPTGRITVCVMSFWMASMVILGSLSSLFEGMKHYTARQALLLSYYGSAFTLVLLLRSHLTSQKAGLAMAVGGLLACLVFTVYVHKTYGYRFIVTGHSLKEHLPRILHLSKWVSLSAAGFMIIFSMDSVMLTYYCGLHSVALYNIALPIMQMFLSVILIFPQVFAPISTELLHLKQYRKLHRHMLGLTLTIFAVMTIGTTLLFFLRHWIIALLFSSDYIPAAMTMIILVAGIPFYAVAQIHMTVLNGLGRQKTAAVIVLSGLALNVTLNALFIPMADIQGAASATLLTYVFLCLGSAIIVWSLRLDQGVTHTVNKLTEPSG